MTDVNLPRGARNRLAPLSSAWVVLRALMLATLLGVGTPGVAQAGSYEDFFQACKTDNRDGVAELLQRGFDPNTIEEERGDTGLILALREDSMQVVQALLKSPDINLEAKAKNGDNALMIAAFKGNEAAVRLLLAKGAKVNRPGWAPLHYAAAQGSTTIVALLLEKNAAVDALSPNKTTPMMMAARGGHIWVVKQLLDAGANPVLVNDQGYDAVAMAKINNNTDIVEGLLYRINKLNKAGKTP